MVISNHLRKSVPSGFDALKKDIGEWIYFDTNPNLDIGGLNFKMGPNQAPVILNCTWIYREFNYNTGPTRVGGVWVSLGSGSGLAWT